MMSPLSVSRLSAVVLSLSLLILPGQVPAQPRDLPESAPRLPGLEAEHPQHARAVADYIAGMTDRFALREHERLSGERLFD